MDPLTDEQFERCGRLADAIEADVVRRMTDPDGADGESVLLLIVSGMVDQLRKRDGAADLVSTVRTWASAGVEAVSYVENGAMGPALRLLTGDNSPL